MSILTRILTSLAWTTLARHKPIIIAVTGSVGKISTQLAISEVLKKFYRVRAAHENYITEMGVLLTILGMDHQGKNSIAWARSLLRVACDLYLSKKEYPEALVLEYGIDRPGDMDRLLSIAKPDIAVVTAVGEVPSHIEFFKDAEELTSEKAKLVQALSVDGYAILNHDDYAVYDMKEKTKAHVLTYGFEEQAELRIVNYELRSVKDEKLGDTPDGITFKIQQNGSVVPVRLHNVFGTPACYAATAAAAVGLVLNRNLIEISESLHSYQSPPGRLCLLKGIKRSFILDDTSNASPESMRTALDTLKAIPGKRKIAVLGDMLEIGKYTEQAHRSIGDKASEFVDMLITVGARAKFIADEALNHGLEKNVRLLTRKQVMSFDDAPSAGHALDPLIEEGDIILVKGSAEMRMEHAVFEIMAQPLRAKELLVRQE